VNLVIFGLGKFGELAHFYFSRAGYTVEAFTVDDEYLDSAVFCGVPVIPFSEVQDLYTPETVQMFVAIGYSQVNTHRARKCAEAMAKGYELASYVSPRATVYSEVKGYNCFVFEDNTIQPFARIGNNVIIWSGSHIGHHARIGDHCFITSHCVIAGSAQIGDYCFIGVNASIRDEAKVGARSIIGMGATVYKDVPEDSKILPTIVGRQR
jgi:sugar O-acyltransferase (sialic acid O-acetyltransferase NeuD family)